MGHRLTLSLTAPALLGAVLALGACSHERGYVAGDMSWSLNAVEGEGLKLAFAQPRTGKVAVTMTCAPRSGEVLVSLNAPARTEPRLTLAAGGRSANYPADLGPNLGEGAVVEATAQAGDPVLDAFARTGGVSLAAGPHRARPPANPPLARRFMDGCRA